MALTVETGAGLVNADAYISISFADTYHRDRNNTSWSAASRTAREAAILNATEYIDSNWNFQGDITFPETPQALAWPRAGVYDDGARLLDDDALPLGVQRATAEMALAIIDNSNAAQSSFVKGATHRRRERVGVMESEIEGNLDENVVTFPRVHRLLMPFITTVSTGAGAAPIVRA